MPPVGLPRDGAQWIALVLAAVVVLAARPLLAPSARPRAFVVTCATAALALSAAYVFVYLRGGPRIIDATSYWLEARALAEGMLSFPLPEPETSVLGRFLVRSQAPDGPHAAVIFPPGYPAVLALGFLARAPLAVGPVLAFAIAVATFDLARRVTPSLPALASGPVSVAQLAALFSVVCAALRYHTADTMSHGLAALLVASAIAIAWRAADAPTDDRATALGGASGFALGWLFATRPVSAAALGVALLFVLARDPAARPRAARLGLAMAAGAVPGVALFFLHQHAATGAWATSSQRAYYAVSDGPPGCFRYGFGDGIGCLGEHADFVRARLAGGFGALAAAGTTLRRLKMHLVDPANLEPLALLVPMGAWAARSSARGRALGLAVAAQILAYAPFYFDGNYPGGGARFFCDVLPLEHVLAALAVATLAAKAASPARAASFALALAFVGFAFRAGLDHASLRDREGGRPFFEPSVLARAGVDRGLVFFDTDHGFDLAFDPGAKDGITAARFHGDALDRATWQAHGRPPAFRYRFVIDGEGAPASVGVEPLVLSPRAGPDVIEGESLWPPLAQRGGWALPEWASGSCASGSRWLEVHASRAGAPAQISVALPASLASGRDLHARVALAGGARGAVQIAGVTTPFGAPPTRAGTFTCIDLPLGSVRSEARFPADPVVLTLTAEPGGSVALDAITATTPAAP
jgi:hypothetical protein